MSNAMRAVLLVGAIVLMASSASAHDILPGEDFRAFYVRTTGAPWPGISGERLSDIFKRLAAVTADWCDALAARQQQAAK